MIQIGNIWDHTCNFSKLRTKLVIWIYTGIIRVINTFFVDVIFFESGEANVTYMNLDS